MMPLAPGLQEAVEEVQAIIDAAPKHPLYDVFVNVEMMEQCRGTAEIIISWRGKVEWTHEEYRRRTAIVWDASKYHPGGPLPKDLVPQPEWGKDIATSVFMINADAEYVVRSILKMIDVNFLYILEKVDFATNNWVWAKSARFR